MTKPKTWKDDELGENTHPYNDAITIIITIHNHVARRVPFNSDNSNNVPYNDAMKKTRIS